MRQTLDKISTKFLRVVPFVLSFFVPLFFLPFTADFFAFSKYYLIAVIGSLSLIAWCIRNITRGKLQFTSSPALIPLVILVLANIVSSVWISSTKHTSLFGQTSLFFFLTIIFITVTSSQKNRFTINSSIYGLIASTTLLSIFTIAHYFGLTAQITSSEIFTNRFFNPTGSILPALSLTIPVLIATTIYTTSIKNWVKKSLLFASVLLMIVSSVINISLILPQNSSPVISILPFDAGWSIAVDTMKTWKTALLGTGPETYFTTFTRLRPAYLNLTKDIWSIRFSESSNFLFTLLTTTGLIGALAFLASFVKPLVVAIKNKKDTEDKAAHSFIISALIVTTLSFLIIPTGIVSLMLGTILLICLTVEEKLANQKSVKDISLSLSTDTQNVSAYNDLPEATRSTSSFLPWLITLLSVSLLSGYWYYASRLYLASVSYKQASDIIQKDPYNAFLKYQKAATLDPYNPYYEQKLSQIYLAVSEAYLNKKDATTEEKTAGTDFAQRSLDAAKLAAQTDPYNVTNWENLFSIYRSMTSYAEGSADMALSHGLQAISLDPTNPALYLQIGTLIYNLGDTDQSVKYIERASELKPNWNIPYYNLSAIYKAKKEYPKALQYAQLSLQYTGANDSNLAVLQEEVDNLKKMVPANSQQQTASPSGTVKQ